MNSTSGQSNPSEKISTLTRMKAPPYGPRGGFKTAKGHIAVT